MHITFLWTKTSISYDQSNAIGSYRMSRLSIYDTAKLIIQRLRKLCFAIYSPVPIFYIIGC